jgi:hypothetical protein
MCYHLNIIYRRHTNISQDSEGTSVKQIQRETRVRIGNFREIEKLEYLSHCSTFHVFHALSE